jgi:hypothetical protein
VSASALSQNEYSDVERFGLHLPYGADDGVRYAPDDADPTPDAGSMEGRYCADWNDGFGCTWPVGHAHPQHVASGTRGLVLAVWDAAPPTRKASSDGHVRAMRRGFLVVGAGLLIAVIAVALVVGGLW